MNPRTHSTRNWYAKQSARFKANKPTTVEVDRIAVQAQTGEEGAKERVVQIMAGACLYLAKGFLYVQGDTESFAGDDLFQEGSIAVLDAIENYDERLGHFQPYCYQRIKWRMMNLRWHSTLVRIPGHLGPELTPYLKGEAALSEVAGEDYEPSRLYYYEEGHSCYLCPCPCPPWLSRVRAAIALTGRINLEDEEWEALAEEDAEAEGLEAAFHGLLQRDLTEAVSSLPERVRYVLKRRYGIAVPYYSEPATLAEIGDELDISRERVRQLHREGERQLLGMVGKHRLSDWPYRNEARYAKIQERFRSERANRRESSQRNSHTEPPSAKASTTSTPEEVALALANIPSDEMPPLEAGEKVELVIPDGLRRQLFIRSGSLGVVLWTSGTNRTASVTVEVALVGTRGTAVLVFPRHMIERKERLE